MQAAAFFLALSAAPAWAQIIPKPQSIRPGSGDFTLAAGAAMAIPAGDRGAAFAARFLMDLWRRSNQLELHLIPGSRAAAIRFLREPGRGAEAYRLQVTTGGVTVSASTSAGLLYGAVSLWQLLPAGRGVPRIAAQTVEDAPRFAWRGLMLDSSRHFQSPAFVRTMIDWMTWHKLNVLHWHLTDDQGWRIEIRRYPRLTRVGAWRGEPRYGGFYTQSQLAELVAYARARNVTIVPEIDMPGHATAAIAAYPRLGATTEPLRVSSSWGVHRHLFNLEPATFAFLEGVLDEVMQIFPSHYIHVGGDEAVKDEWHGSAAVQARARQLGILGDDDLQAYFTQSIGRYLRAHGRRLVGWDEILAPGLAADAVVMSWRGVAGAHDAALAGNDTVLTPQPILYLDHRQSTLPSEPPGRLPPITVKDVYGFEPLDPTLTAQAQRHVLGVQANIWTEHIDTEARVEWMALPRAAALAEAGWSRERDWPDFAARLAQMFKRYEAFHLHYSDSLYGIEAHISRQGPAARFALSSRPELPPAASPVIRYAIDRDPTIDAANYESPIEVGEGHELRAAAYLGADPVSREWHDTVDAHTGLRRFSTEMEVCTDAVGLLLDPVGARDGDRPMAIDIMNPCWIERGVELSKGGRISAAVAALPFNYELGDEVDKIRIGDARSAAGELEVRADRCDAPVLLRLPLGPAVGHAGYVTLPEARLPEISGRHDLCLRIARPTLEPLWGLGWIEISD